MNEKSIPSAGSAVDFAPFGKVIYFYGDDPRAREFPDAIVENGLYLPSSPDSGNRRHIGLQWADPRDIYSVAVTFESGSMPDPEGVEVQYWQRRWPYTDKDERRGAHRGWQGRDDHYRGEWVTALSEVRVEGSKVSYNFHHLDLTEIRDARVLDNAQDFNTEFRRALQFRVLLPEGVNLKIAKIEAFGRGVWQEAEADVFGARDFFLEAYNGYITELGDAGEFVRIKYLRTPAPADAHPHERTVITIRDDEHPFSFAAADLDSGPIWIKDYGVLVRPGSDTRERDVIIEQLEMSGVPSIYDRVFDEPEQTLERAMAEVPRLRAPFQHPPRGRYCPLGCEGSRQRFGLRYNGNVFVDKLLNKAAGRDLINLLWSGTVMDYRFGSGDFPNFREYENSCEQRWDPDGAPVITSQWVDRDIEYTQTACAAYLREDMGEYFGKRGDEDIVLLVQFEIRNIAHDGRRAHLWMQSQPYETFIYESSLLSAEGRVVRTEQLDSDELAARVDRPDVPQTFNWVTRCYDEPLIRCRIDLGKGCGFVSPLSMDREGPAGALTAFHYQADLRGGERDVITFVIPYCTVRSDDDLQILGSIDYNAKLRDVREFWVPFTDLGMKINIPDMMVQEFFHKVPVHVAITATRDPGSGEYVLPAATFRYGACGNEAVIQIRQLDFRGMHAQAEKYLDGLLLMQGVQILDGNFKTSEGSLAGIGFYNGKPLGYSFSYNTDHGFELWALSEHYFITRDKDWLARKADNIIAGCDFVIRERQATKLLDENGERVAEYGLMPAGHLEDNDEWRYWFAVNVHAFLGIKWAAEALTEISHPDAQRLAAEAAAYLEDILASVNRVMIEAPVVKLPDNTAVPHIPVRTDIRGKEWGWFREGAYGALHLVDGEVLDPCDERVTWTMKFLEDLIYPSRDWGRPIDLEKRWFSQGGVTIQANLLNNGTAYVRRDEPKHAVRALFNDFAASIYPDVLIFTEHPVTQLSRGVGPYYKTPDECGFLNTLRMCLVIEQGDTLFLAKAAPVSWFKVGETVEVTDAATYFGPVSYSICVGEDTMEATVRPPRRNPPGKLALRLRRADGKEIAGVSVNEQAGEWDAEREMVWLDPEVEEIRVVARS